MTIDDLAAMMSREFERTRAEFKSELKSEINRLDLGIDRLDKRMARFEYQLDELKDILRHLEDVDIANIQKRVVYLEQELKNLKKIASK